MGDRIRCIEMQHINIVTNDFDVTMEHFRKVFGAQFVHDIPADAWHAVLIHIGGVIFELFVPHQFILNARYGPHYLGIEYQVGDVGEARDWFGERGVGLVRDIGIAIHTDPADTIGVAWEFFDQSFHRGSPVEWLEPLHPAEHWRDHHPIGLLGLKRYSIVIGDVTAALAFFEDTFEHTVEYVEQRRMIGAHVTGIRLADTTIELMSPTGDGAVRDHLRRFGDGVRSVVFQVADLEATERHFSKLGIELVAGDHSDSLAIRPHDNRGVMMEFAR